MLYKILRLILAVLGRLLFGVEARGTEYVPRSGPVLIVANHASVLDPPIMGVVVPRPLYFLAKAELFSLPLFGRLIAAVNARPVRREGADPRALRTALRVLEMGRALLIFPEGTRGEGGTLGPGKAGAGMLAALSGAPVVPAYIEGSGRALPRGRWLPRLAKIRVRFGPPLSVSEDGRPNRKERYREVSRQMMAAIARLKAEAEGRPQEVEVRTA